MRTFREIERSVFGPRANVFVVYSAPDGVKASTERLRASAEYASDADAIEAALPRLAGLHPVMLVEYGFVLPADVRQMQVVEYLRRNVRPDAETMKIEFGFLSKPDVVDLFSEWFNRPEMNLHPFILSGPQGPEHILPLRSGERLCTATFGISPIPRSDRPESAQL